MWIKLKILKFNTIEYLILIHRGYKVKIISMDSPIYNVYYFENPYLISEE